MKTLQQRNIRNERLLCGAIMAILVAIAVILALYATQVPVLPPHFLETRVAQEVQHLPLSVADNITNRCFVHREGGPCRPFLGHVKKKLRIGLIPGATQVAYSDAYKFIFIKTRKTAGSTLLNGYLRPALCPVRPGDASVRHWWKKVNSVPIRANCPESIISPTIEAGFESNESRLPPPMSTMPWDKLEKYFVFAAVRNPYERAVSSYNYCKLRRFGTFQEFAENPGNFRGVCGGLTRHADAKIPYTHWDPLMPELCDASGVNCAVDYVVDTGNISAMMDEVITEINKRREPNVPPLQRFADVAIDLNRRNKDDYSKFYNDCSDCERLVKQYYLEDVSMLGYEFPYSRKVRSPV